MDQIRDFVQRLEVLRGQKEQFTEPWNMWYLRNASAELSWIAESLPEWASAFPVHTRFSRLTVPRADILQLGFWVSWFQSNQIQYMGAKHLGFPHQKKKIKKKNSVRLGTWAAKLRWQLMFTWTDFEWHSWKFREFSEVSKCLVSSATGLLEKRSSKPKQGNLLLQSAVAAASSLRGD